MDKFPHKKEKSASTGVITPMLPHWTHPAPPDVPSHPFRLPQPAATYETAADQNARMLTAAVLVPGVVPIDSLQAVVTLEVPAVSTPSDWQAGDGAASPWI